MSQNQEPKLLENTSFSELEAKFIEHVKDSALAMPYAEAFLIKAKRKKDTLKMINGYYYQLILDHRYNNIFYQYDSIISLSMSTQNKKFLTVAYFDKGSIYHKKRQFKDALSNLLKAREHNQGSNKEYMEFLLNHSIAVLKTRIDKDDEALELLKNCWTYSVNKNFKDKNPDAYYNVLHNLSNAYRKMNYMDSARVYMRLGLVERNQANDGVNYNKFLMLNGILEISNKNFKEAESNFLQSIKKFEELDDKPAMATAYFFLGNTYKGTKQRDLAVNYFKKVDSIFEITDDILPEHTSGYKYIIDFYREKEDLANQLKYIEKLILIDSTLNENYKYLNEEITEKFDVPKLIENKELVISRLNLEKKQSKFSNILLWTALLLFLSVAVFQYRKRILYKKRFQNLVTSNNSNAAEEHVSKEEDSTSIEVPKGTIDQILEKLNVFEKEHGFRDEKLNLNSLAQHIGTNSNYLSKVINHYKKLSFSSYIKQLRVAYGFNKLKSNTKFRRYTIKAIAKDCGFKTAESFSKTFYKSYGIYPSYFIKQLEKISA